MSDSVRQQARLVVRDQLGRCHEALAARESRISVQVLRATAAVSERRRVVSGADPRVALAVRERTGLELVQVSDVAALCGRHVPEVRQILRLRAQDAGAVGVGERLSVAARLAEQG